MDNEANADTAVIDKNEAAGDSDGANEDNSAAQIFDEQESGTTVVPDAENSQEGTDDQAVDVKPDAEAKPVEYTEFKVAEGQEMDKTALDAFIPLAKELGLDQDGAQKIVDVVAGMTERVGKAQAQALADQENVWKKSWSEDKEIGGAKYKESVDIALKAIERFGTPELNKFLSASRLGRYPEMGRFFVRVGKAISEDQTVEGANHGQKSNQKFYDNSDHDES
ncbi:hypothetical protein KAR91_23805 [Candidatus Pacearchaeota archaeon]|nr:hypothetical protein [Candidatus Pacearchaeota archaeon]